MDPKAFIAVHNWNGLEETKFLTSILLSRIIEPSID
jgi:hypothetical protein